MSTRYPGTRYQVSHKHTHADRLERWLGKETCEHISASMRSWYGPPIAVAGVPGEVFACGGGEFVGRIDGGQECTWADRARQAWKRWVRSNTIEGRYSPAQMNAFGSISAIVNAINGGKCQRLIVGNKAALNSGNITHADLWSGTGFPVAGSAGAAAPGGTATTNATTGHWGFGNPTNANTAHIARAQFSRRVADHHEGVLLVDQLFRVAKTMNSTATEAVTGTFSRYQSSTSTDENYAGGTFCFPSVTSALPTTAHNWTVCQYTDQDGNTANSFPSFAGQGSSPLGTLDIPQATTAWFMPLASGDVGVKALTQMQCSALVATGGINFVVAHPLALCPVAGNFLFSVADGLRTAMEFVRVYDNACISALVLRNTQGLGTALNGYIDIVAE